MSEQQPQPSDGTVRLVPPSLELTRYFGADSGVEMFFDPKTPEGAELLFKATLDKLPQLSDKAGETIAVKSFFQHPAEHIQPDGEVRPFLRSVIFDSDNNAYDCGSEGVRKATVLLCSVRGVPPWNPPIRCKVVVQKTRQGRNWMILRPDASEIFKNVTSPATNPHKREK